MATACTKRIIVSLLISINVSLLFSQENLLWKYSTKSRIYSSPVISGDIVYFGSNDASLYALNKTNGSKIWTYSTNGQLKSTPCIHKNTIIFNSTDGYVYSCDKKTGKLIWKFQTGGEKVYDLWDYYTSSPLLYGDNIFIGSGDGSVYSLDANTGEKLWQYQTQGIVHATPVIADNKILVGSYDGFFYALDHKTGELVWKFNTIGDRYFPKGEVQNGALVYKNSVIFGSRDYNIYSLNIATGEGFWNMKEHGSWIIATPLKVGENIFFGTSDTHTFYCMNGDSGEVVWTKKLNMRIYGTAAYINNSVYFGCFNGKIYGVDVSSGKDTFVFQTAESKEGYPSIFEDETKFIDTFDPYGPDMGASETKILNLGSILSSPIVEHNIIYFGDSNGNFYAVKGTE